MWILLAILVISILATVLLTPKAKVQNAVAGQFNQVNFPQASASSPVPLIFGSVKQRGPNTIWAGQFHAYPITNDVKSGPFGNTKQTIGYTYFLGLDLALCLGEGVIFRRLWFDKNLVWAGPAQSFSDGSPYIVIVNDQQWNGGQNSGGGYSGAIRMYSGNFVQQQDLYLIQKLDPNVPTYAGICHVVFQGFYWGTQNTLPGINFDLTRLPNTLGMPNGIHAIPDPAYTESLLQIPAQPASPYSVGSDITNPLHFNPPPNPRPILGAEGEFDLNPMELIYQVLTQAWGCLGMDPALLNIPAFLTAAQTLFDDGNGISMLIDTTNAAKDVLAHVLTQIQGLLYQDQTTGLITPKLIRNDYSIGDLIVLDESSIVSLTKYNTQTWKQTFNQVRLDFISRRNLYEADYALAQDFANFDLQGRLISSSISMPTVFAPQNALNIAARELSLESVPLYRCDIEVNRSAFGLFPGAVFVLNWADYGIQQQVFRVQKMKLGTLDKGNIMLTCLQDVFAAQQTVYGSPATRPDGSGGLHTPIPIIVKLIEELPRFYLNMAGITQVFGQCRVRALAENPGGYSTAFTLLSAPVLFPTPTAPITTELAGEPFLNIATLLLAYSEVSPNFYDTTVGVLLANTPDLTNLASPATDAQLRDGYNLFYLNEEYFNFSSYVVNSDGSCLLQNVRRSLLDTKVQPNAPGDIAWFADTSSASGNVFPAGAGPGGAVGHTNFYFLDETDQQVDVIQNVLPTNPILQQRADKPLPPRFTKFNGADVSSIQYVFGTDLVLTWRESDLTLPTIVWEDDATQPPASLQTYVATAYHGQNYEGNMEPPFNVFSTAPGQTTIAINLPYYYSIYAQGFFLVTLESVASSGQRCLNPRSFRVNLMPADSNAITDRSGDIVLDRQGNIVNWREGAVDGGQQVVDRMGNYTTDRSGNFTDWR